MKDIKEPNSEKLNRIIQVLCDIAYKLDVLVSDEYKRTHCYHSRFIYNPDKQKTPDDWNIPRY